MRTEEQHWARGREQDLMEREGQLGREEQLGRSTSDPKKEVLGYLSRTDEIRPERFKEERRECQRSVS